jgi:phosphomannomutase
VPVFCDLSTEALASGFPRRPEPTAANLSELRRVVRTGKLDMGIAFDPDGDRTSCVDETGFALGEEATICLACEYVLLHRKGPVVVNLSTTRGVEDICANHRVQVLRSPVGEASVVERMVEVNAVLGGEGNGGVILPEVNFTRDGLVATATVLGLVAATGKPLSVLRRELPSYQVAKTTTPLSREQYEARRSRLLAAFEDCRVDERDGLKFDGPDYWVHVRPSNTEPLVRIIVEARDPDALDRLIARARAALTERS